MMRVCPKCGDYYADPSAAFCLADGAPLVDVDPRSDAWGEGVRVIEEKERAGRRLRRRLKWRRVLLISTTMLVVTMVVVVVAVNSFIYLRPAPTPTPTPTPTPPVCSEEDKGREREAIIGEFGPRWRREIERERDKIIAGKRPPRVADADIVNDNRLADAPKVEATLGEVVYESSFPKPCSATLTARYAWEVRIYFNGAVESESVKGKRTFACAKKGTSWGCD